MSAREPTAGRPRLVFATRNRGKVAELRALLAEAAFIRRGGRLPIGASALALARRTAA